MLAPRLSVSPARPLYKLRFERFDIATKKQLIRIDLIKGDHSTELVTGKIPDIKRKLDALAARAPEYADEITIDLESYEYYGSTTISLDAYYYREENAEERKERLAKNNDLREQQKRIAEKQIADYRKRFPELFEEKE